MKSTKSLNSKINNNLVKGYNGIMDLDLKMIPKMFHEEMIKLHFKDIKEYIAYQTALPEKLRYENTIVRINQQLEK